MEGEETCFPVFGISVLTVGLYPLLLNTECVLTVCKLLKIHSETIKWHAALDFYYLIINQNICYFFFTYYKLAHLLLFSLYPLKNGLYLW